MTLKIGSLAIIFMQTFVARIFCELVIRLQFAFSVLEMMNPLNMLLLTNQGEYNICKSRIICENVQISYSTNMSVHTCIISEIQLSFIICIIYTYIQ